MSELAKISSKLYEMKIQHVIFSKELWPIRFLGVAFVTSFCVLNFNVTRL